MHKVNLDALIQREDFELVSQGHFDKKPQLRLLDLEQPAVNFGLLRKPLFQRDTSSWPPEKIVEFIKSFLDGELIPNVIVWWSRQSGRIWVIDGAHRLSALIAWVNDDYGDGLLLSKPFFAHRVPPEQQRLADQTRTLIEREIGGYKKLLYVERNPTASDSDLQRLRSNGFTALPIDAQWVDGDASKAEISFKKINGNPTTIEPIELDIIDARKKPNAIATRAIMRQGTGYRYWNFDEQHVTEIEKLAKDIHSLLFDPILQTPVRTFDLPIAGEGYSAEAFKLIFDIVNIFNEFTPSMWRTKKTVRRRKNSKPVLPDDETGDATLEVLNRIKKLVQLISADDDPRGGSLGLDPAVYFWGATGRFHPQAVLAVLKFVKELRTNNKFETFTDVRAHFEGFLLRHRSFTNQIAKLKGSRQRSLESLVEMYRILFGHLVALPDGEAPSDSEIIAAMQANPKLKDLVDKSEDEASEDEGIEEGRRVDVRFPVDVQSAGFLKQTKDAAPLCPICRARLHIKSMSKDHKTEVRNRGRGQLRNLQLTHPYCNTGYREAKAAKGISVA